MSAPQNPESFLACCAVEAAARSARASEIRVRQQLSIAIARLQRIGETKTPPQVQRIDPQI